MRSERDHLLQDLIVTAFERLYGLESLNQSEENLSKVNDHLEVGSAVFYFNHISLIDPPMLIAYLLDHLDNMRNLAVPTSRRHQDIRRKPHLDSLAIHMVQFVNVEVLPIVQRSIKDNDPYFDERGPLLRNYIRRSREILGEPGGVMLVAPEGTRSENGKLQKAESGFEKLGRYGQVKYVPVAVIPGGEFKRNLWIGNLGFNVGEPFDITESLSQDGLSPKDTAMARLANLLPKNMQGEYLSNSNDGI